MIGESETTANKVDSLPKIGSNPMISKEIDSMKNVEITETLKESLAKERKEYAQKRIQELEKQLSALTGDVS